MPACSKKDSPTKIDDPQILTETQEMKALSENLIVALKSGDVPKILSHLNEEYHKVYSDIQNQPAANLAALGTALESRKLIAASPLYAEYSIIINDQEFRVAYAQCGDDNWQLVGF